MGQKGSDNTGRDRAAGEAFTPPVRVTVIKHHGEVTEAKTTEGHRVKKKEKLYIKQLNETVPCVDYHGEHFIFLDPEFDKHVGRWFAFCTCGSPAVLLGGDFLDGNYSMIACKFHLENGHHQTSILNLKAMK